MITRMNYFNVYYSRCFSFLKKLVPYCDTCGMDVSSNKKVTNYNCRLIYCSKECYFDGLLDFTVHSNYIDTEEDLAGLIAACNRRLKKIKEEENNGSS